MTRLVSIGGAQIAVSSSLDSPPQALPSSEAQTRAVLRQYIELMYGRREVDRAFRSCVALDEFVEHDSSLPPARDEALQALRRKLEAPAFHAEVLDLDVRGELAVLQLRVQDAAAPGCRTEMFRVRNARIVEHWLLH